MEYPNILSATFLSRPNRFIAYADLNGSSVVCHVKNTGRCRELLLPGATVWLQDHGESPVGRKTRYDLIAVEKMRPVSSPLLINMDSQAPNQLFREWAEQGGLFPDITLLRPEVRYGSSRFDFYYERSNGERGFVEVKGVTLEENGITAFPDAPTERGIKHLEELCAAVEAGYSAHICFVIQMEGMSLFCPNERTHPAFADALRKASAKGVSILALECSVTPDSLFISHPVPIDLSAAHTTFGSTT